LELILSLIDLKSINWADVKIPEGRTQKACMHIITKMRQTYKKNGEGAGEADNNNSSPAKITKPKLSPRKKNSPTKRKKQDDFIDDTEQDETEAEIDEAVHGRDDSSINKKQKLARQKQEDEDDVIKAEDISDVDDDEIVNGLAQE